MKKFLIACKKRPLVLWILLLCWIVITVAVSLFLLYTYSSPVAFSVFILLIMPILHLCIYVKPLIVYEIVSIVFTNLAIASFIFSYIWVEMMWRIWIIALVSFLIAGSSFVLEIRMFEKKIRDGTFDEYMKKLGGRTYIQ